MNPRRIRPWAAIFPSGLQARLCLCAALLVVIPLENLTAEDAGPGPNIVETWQKAGVFLFDEAHADFVRGSTSNNDKEVRANRLGEAVTLLTLQPRTQGNITKAQTLFEELIVQDPKDASGLAARMHLARLFEFHASPQAPQKAREIYLGLLTDGSGDPLAELAASRLALIDLYATDSPESLNDAARQLAAHATKLQTSIGRRQLYSNLGLTLHQLRGDKKLAMDYLIAAEAEGLPMKQLDAPVLIAIGALAEELGDLETAKKYYSLFTSRYKRDGRHYSVIKKLEELGVTSDSSTSPGQPPPDSRSGNGTHPQS